MTLESTLGIYEVVTEFHLLNKVFQCCWTWVKYSQFKSHYYWFENMAVCTTHLSITGLCLRFLQFDVPFSDLHDTRILVQHTTNLWVTYFSIFYMHIGIEKSLSCVLFCSQICLLLYLLCCFLFRFLFYFLFYLLIQYGCCFWRQVRSSAKCPIWVQWPALFQAALTSHSGCKNCYALCKNR